MQADPREALHSPALAHGHVTWWAYLWTPPSGAPAYCSTPGRTPGEAAARLRAELLEHYTTEAEDGLDFDALEADLAAWLRCPLVSVTAPEALAARVWTWASRLTPAAAEATWRSALGSPVHSVRELDAVRASR
jgi:hypothetical protein